MVLMSPTIARGSPPLARGKVYIKRFTFLAIGITPACAGKRDGQGKHRRRRWDHPRLRGEKASAKRTFGFCFGSPPLARGKVSRTDRRIRWIRITPACAGKSFAPCTFIRAHKDHPRLRGEKILRPTLSTMRKGSPPLARGKVQIFKNEQFGEGITPACAGKRLKGSLNIGFLRRSRSIFI